ncbi:MAG: hypothetical protein ACI959_001338 [Limisphaerales bacterium]|jgi:hypothetical protein
MLSTLKQLVFLSILFSSILSAAQTESSTSNPLQIKLGKENKVLVEYSINKAQLEIIYTDRTSQQLFEKEITNEFTRALNTFKAELKDPDIPLSSSGHILYNWLIDTFSDNLGSRELLIIEDGNFSIPFEALLTTASDQSFLIKSRSLSYHHNSAAFISDTIVKNNRLGYLGYACYKLGKAEIAKSSNIFNGRFRKGIECEELDFKREADNVKILHIAARSSEPTILNFYKDDLGMEDGTLQTEEIEALDINTDLLIYTPLLDSTQNPDIKLIIQAFKNSGCENSLYRLWPAKDLSGKGILTSTLTHIKGGAKRHTALRKAKLDYLNSAQGNATHPAYWSAYILKGSTAPIKTGTEWTWWKVILLAFIMMGSIIIVAKTLSRKEFIEFQKQFEGPNPFNPIQSRSRKGDKSSNS